MVLVSFRRDCMWASIDHYLDGLFPETGQLENKVVDILCAFLYRHGFLHWY